MKIAINGFGRIGRAAFKAINECPLGLEVAAINDLTDTATLVHLLKYDSVYGSYLKDMETTGDGFVIDGKKIKTLAEPDPEKLPWKKMGVRIVLECTGRWRDRASASKHLRAGAKAVVISAPAKDEDI